MEGIRIIDASTVLAAPGASSLLADFGAEVIKVEQPITGDPVRRYPPHIDGQSLGSKVTNRNKLSVTLNLNDERGQEVLRKLVGVSDAVVANFRTPTMKKWGIDYDQLVKVKSDIIVLHLTGFGRTGPYSERPGFARVAEAFVGLTHMSGYPDRGPMFAGYALGDGIGAIYGAFSLMLALYNKKITGQGQLADLALYEPIMRILDSLYISYDQTGEIPGRVGTINPTVSPSDIYQTQDQQWVVLPVSTQTMFARMCEVIGHPEIPKDPRFATNGQRVIHREALDNFIVPFIKSKTLEEFLNICNSADIAAGPVNNVKQAMEDRHLRERSSFETIWDENLKCHVQMQGVFPKLSRTPGSIRWPGHEPGQDNDYVYQNILGFDESKIGKMKHDGII